MQGGGGQCESTGTGPGAEHWAVLSNLLMDDSYLYGVFCQMQGGGGECESTRTGPGAE